MTPLSYYVPTTLSATVALTPLAWMACLGGLPHSEPLSAYTNAVSGIELLLDHHEASLNYVRMVAGVSGFFGVGEAARVAVTARSVQQLCRGGGRLPQQFESSNAVSSAWPRSKSMQYASRSFRLSLRIV